MYLLNMARVKLLMLRVFGLCLSQGQVYLATVPAAGPVAGDAALPKGGVTDVPMAGVSPGQVTVVGPVPETVEAIPMRFQLQPGDNLQSIQNVPFFPNLPGTNLGMFGDFLAPYMEGMNIHPEMPYYPQQLSRGQQINQLGMSGIDQSSLPLAQAMSLLSGVSDPSYMNQYRNDQSMKQYQQEMDYSAYNPIYPGSDNRIASRRSALRNGYPGEGTDLLQITQPRPVSLDSSRQNSLSEHNPDPSSVLSHFLTSPNPNESSRRSNLKNKSGPEELQLPEHIVNTPRSDLTSKEWLKEVYWVLDAMKKEENEAKDPETDIEQERGNLLEFNHSLETNQRPIIKDTLEMNPEEGRPISIDTPTDRESILNLSKLFSNFRNKRIGWSLRPQADGVINGISASGIKEFIQPNRSEKTILLPVPTKNKNNEEQKKNLEHLESQFIVFVKKIQKDQADKPPSKQVFTLGKFRSIIPESILEQDTYLVNSLIVLTKGKRENIPQLEYSENPLCEEIIDKLVLAARKILDLRMSLYGPEAVDVSLVKSPERDSGKIRV